MENITRNTPQDMDKEFPGYKKYPANEDIYAKAEKAGSLNEETGEVIENENTEATVGTVEYWNEKDVDEHLTGDDLDVPGSELDDESEAIGSEDEENNYYSIGSDNHSNLEEEQGS